MAKGSGTTRRGSASNSRGVGRFDTSTKASPLSASEQSQYNEAVRAREANWDKAYRYANSRSKIDPILRGSYKRASDAVTNANKTIDDLRYNRAAINKTIREFKIGAERENRFLESSGGYRFSGMGSETIKISGKSYTDQIGSIIESFNRNGAAVKEVKRQGDTYYIDFKKRFS